MTEARASFDQCAFFFAGHDREERGDRGRGKRVGPRQPEMQRQDRGLAADPAALADLPVDAWPSGANFILFRPRAKDGHDVWQGLVDRSVLVRNCASWPGLEGCLRVTVGTRPEDDAFLAALTEVLS